MNLNIWPLQCYPVYHVFHADLLWQYPERTEIDLEHWWSLFHAPIGSFLTLYQTGLDRKDCFLQNLLCAGMHQCLDNHYILWTNHILQKSSSSSSTCSRHRSEGYCYACIQINPPDRCPTERSEVSCLKHLGSLLPVAPAGSCVTLILDSVKSANTGTPYCNVATTTSLEDLSTAMPSTADSRHLPMICRHKGNQLANFALFLLFPCCSQQILEVASIRLAPLSQTKHPKIEWTGQQTQI